MLHYDYLIVGQGIAGTLLIHFLKEKEKRMLVTDHYNPSSASHVAAGLINPITGRRFVKTWKADSILPFAEETYLKLEELLGTKFYFKRNIVKFLSDKEDIDIIKGKSESKHFMDYVVPPSNPENPIIEITKSGYLDMSKLVIEYRKTLEHQNIIVDDLFRNEDMTIEKEKVYWKGKAFHKVIFCEGYKAVDNPFFSWLPFVLAKGEILLIESPDLPSEKILMKGIFVLPIGKNMFKVGSTYTWNSLDESTTVEAKREIVTKLESLVNCHYTIVGHYAGIRPTVRDRKPVIGLHPLQNNVGIFNGMGAKGASLAPYFSKQFVEFLEEGKPLDNEVNIARFIRMFPKYLISSDLVI